MVGEGEESRPKGPLVSPESYCDWIVVLELFDEEGCDGEDEAGLESKDNPAVLSPAFNKDLILIFRDYNWRGVNNVERNLLSIVPINLLRLDLEREAAARENERS